MVRGRENVRRGRRRRAAEAADRIDDMWVCKGGCGMEDGGCRELWTAILAHGIS